jgi:dCTP deaminase
MTVLADWQIVEEIEYGDLNVEPVNYENQLQPATLDVRLGNKYRTISEKVETIDTQDFDSGCVFTEENTIELPDAFGLWPGDFILTNTMETFDFPDCILGEITGRSSIGRLGITVHQTAGLFDPGFTGEGVLEIHNVSDKKIILHPGQRIAQMKFQYLDAPASSPYNSEDNSYQEQEGATPSRFTE